MCEDGDVQGSERRSEVVDEFLEEALGGEIECEMLG